MTSKAANLTRAQFTFQLRREHVIDACETRDRILCDLSATTLAALLLACR